MSRSSKLLTTEVFNKATLGLELLGKTGDVAIKLMAIIAAKKHGLTAVCKIFGMTKATLISWIKRLDVSLEQLKVQEGRGRKLLLQESDEALVRRWILEDPQITINKLQSKIQEELKVQMSRATVHRLMKRLRFSYITPRPQHHKQDPQTLEGSKKKSDRKDQKKS